MFTSSHIGQINFPRKVRILCKNSKDIVGLFVHSQYRIFAVFSAQRSMNHKSFGRPDSIPRQPVTFAPANTARGCPVGQRHSLHVSSAPFIPAERFCQDSILPGRTILSRQHSSRPEDCVKTVLIDKGPRDYCILSKDIILTMLFMFSASKVGKSKRRS